MHTTETAPLHSKSPQATTLLWPFYKDIETEVDISSLPDKQPQLQIAVFETLSLLSGKPKPTYTNVIRIRHPIPFLLLSHRDEDTSYAGPLLARNISNFARTVWGGKKKRPDMRVHLQMLVCNVHTLE